MCHTCFSTKGKSSSSLLLAKLGYVEWDCQPSNSLCETACEPSHLIPPQQRRDCHQEGSTGLPACPINLEEQKAITRASKGWETVFIPSGISHLYGKKHSPDVLELVCIAQSDLWAQQKQFLLSPIPYVWWRESNLLPEGGGLIAVLPSS